MAKFEKWLVRTAVAASILAAGAALAGCGSMKNAMSGEVIGASVTVGGFTVGLSGKFPGSKSGG